MNCSQGHIYNIIGPRAKQCNGAHIYTTTHMNKIINVDKINHIFITLLFPTKSVFKHLKTCCIQHRLACGPYATAQRAHALRRH